MRRWMMIMVLGVVACGPEDETPVDDGGPQQPLNAEITAEFIDYQLGIHPVIPGYTQDESTFRLLLNYNEPEFYFLREGFWYIQTEGEPIEGKKFGINPCTAEKSILIQGSGSISIDITCTSIRGPFEGEVTVGYNSRNRLTKSNIIYIDVDAFP